MSVSLIAAAGYLSRAPLALTQGEPEGNACGLAIDGDEAAHSLYAIMKNSGTGVLQDHAKKQIDLAGHHRLADSLAFEPLVKGSKNIAELVASSAIVLPFALMAMHAGLAEWKKAPADAAEFAESRQKLQQQAALTTQRGRNVGHLGCSALKTLDDAAAARLVKNERFAKAVHHGGMIGKYSFLSGAAIMGRIVFEIIRNVGGALETGDSNVRHEAKEGELDGPFMMGTGLAANACGCLAGAFALMLGVHFVRKSAHFNEKWSIDAAHLAAKERFLRNADPHYARFVQAKGSERARFAKRFAMKNKMFMAGAGLYAAGTILPSAVKLLASIGVLDSKKVGANMILALFATAMAGALLMGVFSHQFLVGHPKLERYEEYALKETKELDPRFLASVDEFVFRDEKNCVLSAEHSVRRGLAIRSSAFKAIGQSEEIRNALLSEIAREINRTYTPRTHVGDVGYLPETLPAQLKRRYGRTRLKAEDVAQWLQVSENRARAVLCYRRICDAQIGFLEQKTALHGRMHEQLMRDLASDAAAETPIDREQRGKVVAEAIGSYKDSREVLDAYKGLAEKLKPNLNALEFGEVMEAFRELHVTKDAEPRTKTQIKAAKAEDDSEATKTQFERVAEHLVEYMPVRFSNDRGSLLEIEAQAGKQIPRSHNFSCPFVR